MTQDARKLFAARLAELLKDRGARARLSKGKFSPSTVTRWANNGQGVSLENLGTIADRLGRHVAELFRPDGYQLTPEVSTSPVTGVRDVREHAPDVDARVVELEAQNRDLAHKVQTYEAGYRDVLAAFEALLSRYREAGGEDRATEPAPPQRRRRG